jgi:hypothetical protein
VSLHMNSDLRIYITRFIAEFLAGLANGIVENTRSTLSAAATERRPVDLSSRQETTPPEEIRERALEVAEEIVANLEKEGILTPDDFQSKTNIVESVLSKSVCELGS